MSCPNYRTPPHIVELVHEVLGGIDLDLASDAEANKTVRAKSFCSVNSQTPMPAIPQSMFCNPPGGKVNGKSQAIIFWDKLLELRRRGFVSHAIFLAFNINSLCVSQDGVRDHMLDFPTCIPRDRIKFVHPDPLVIKEHPARHNAIIYVPGMVDKTSLFWKHFNHLGDIVVPWS